MYALWVPTLPLRIGVFYPGLSVVGYTHRRTRALRQNQIHSIVLEDASPGAALAFTRVLTVTTVFVFTEKRNLLCRIVFTVLLAMG